MVLALLMTCAGGPGGGEPAPVAAGEVAELAEREAAARELSEIAVGGYFSWWMIAACAVPFVVLGFVVAGIALL